MVTMSVMENKVDDPLKVKNWNNPDKEETRIDYVLSIMESGHWIELGHEIDQNGNVHTFEDYVCSMP